MRALLTGDDGIHSNGLLVQKKWLEYFGFDVFVVASEKNVSWGSKRISPSGVSAREVTLADGSKALAINGFPADAVHIGVLEHDPDIVVSGINVGANFGRAFFLSSATCGAAIEASILGIPAVTVSYHTMDFHSMPPPSEFEVVARYGALATLVALEGIVDIIAVVGPRNPTGYEVVRIADVGYDVLFEKKNGRYVFRRFFVDTEHVEPDTDIAAVVHRNHVAISPVALLVDTPPSKIEELRQLFEKIDGKRDAKRTVSENTSLSRPRT